MKFCSWASDRMDGMTDLTLLAAYDLTAYGVTWRARAIISWRSAGGGLLSLLLSFFFHFTPSLSLSPLSSLSPPSALMLPHLLSLLSYLLVADTRALSASRVLAFLHQPTQFRQQPTVFDIAADTWSAAADTGTISSRYIQRRIRWPRPPGTQISYYLLI
jgi:hypothetical protein